MAELYEWLTGIIQFPQLSFMGYIIAGLITMIIIDAMLSLIFAGVKRMFGGK